MYTRSYYLAITFLLDRVCAYFKYIYIFFIFYFFLALINIAHVSFYKINTQVTSVYLLRAIYILRLSAYFMIHHY